MHVHIGIMDDRAVVFKTTVYSVPAATCTPVHDQLRTACVVIHNSM